VGAINRGADARKYHTWTGREGGMEGGRDMEPTRLEEDMYVKAAPYKRGKQAGWFTRP